MKRLFTFLGTLALLTTCTNPTEDVSLGVNTDFITYTALIEFVDPADPNKIIDQIDMSVAGKDAEVVLESGGTRNYKVVDGKIALALNPKRKGVENDPVSFQIKASAPGYLPVNAEAYFAGEEQQQVISINMVNIQDPPAGVANVTNSAAISNGTTNSTVNVAVSPGADKTTGAEVSIPAGTELLDANGDIISGSNLEVSLTHFDASGEASTSSFPGGFSPSNVINANGEQEDVFFNTAGFASINMSVGNTAVKGFSQDISVSMEIDPQTPNMYTGSNIVAGDTIPIWSYDVATGAWVYEKTGTVVNNGGKLEMVFTTNHLSWYNLDFKGPRCSFYNSSGKVTVNMPGFDYSNAEYLYCDVVFASNGQSVSPFSSKVRRLYDGTSINFYNAPNTLCKFIVYSGSSWYAKGDPIAESAPFNPCNGQTSVTVNRPQPTMISIDLQGSCASNDGLTFKPSFYIYYKKSSDPWYSYLTYTSRGVGSTSRLALNEEYDFRVWYNGQLIEFSATPDKTLYEIDVELDQATCDLIF